MVNTIFQLSTKYLTPNKTIETLSLSNGISEKTLFIYNYKGVFFRVFSSQETLDRFWKGEAEEARHFETEKDLDEWLKSLNGA